MLPDLLRHQRQDLKLGNSVLLLLPDADGALRLRLYHGSLNT